MAVLEHVLTAWNRLRGYSPVTIGGRPYRCDSEHLTFWQKVKRGSWEPQTFAALDTLLTPESVYCDIGAWIGPTVLYAAKSCAKVYCFEPDRIAYMYLLQNIELNKLENVLPFNLALSVDNGLERMASPRGKKGDSMTSLLTPDGARGVEVLCLTWQHWLDTVGTPKIDTMKMDIEGGEFALLPAMADYLASHKPKLYLSLHPHLLPEAERFLAMGRVVEGLQGYDKCYDSSGNRLTLLSLLEEQAVNRAGTYLLLPA